MNAKKEIVKMREGIPDDAYWYCGECNLTHDTQEEAERCCKAVYDQIISTILG